MPFRLLTPALRFAEGDDDDDGALVAFVHSGMI